MRPISALAVLVAFASCAGSCTPPLTPEDAAPFQDCSADGDCVLDTLDCSLFCDQPVAVARDRQQAFEELKGCWPPPQNPSFCPPAPRPCGHLVCSRSHCAIRTACVPPDAGNFGDGGLGSQTDAGAP